MKHLLSFGAALAALVLFGLGAGACQDDDRNARGAGAEQDEHGHGEEGNVDLHALRRAVVVLVPTAGNQARGTLTFEQDGESVRVTADVQGLTPNGRHAYHIHEFGDLRSDDGSAAGSHYNPEGHEHGLPDQEERHAGDFGNLEANAEGRAQKTITVKNVTIGGPMNPIIGRAVIVHTDPDDGGQPTGNAGGRIAQGVIGIAK